MANPRHESRSLTAVGPPASMQRHHPTAFPHNLPVEILHMIIAAIDDLPFAWFVLRHVSSFWRAITEDVFERLLLRTCTITFTGQTIRELSPVESPPVEENSIPGQRRGHVTKVETEAPKPTFRFRPSEFGPPDSKARVLFKLYDLPTKYATVYTLPRQAIQASSSDPLAQIFFRQGPCAGILRRRLCQELHFVHFSNELRNIRLPTLVIDVAARKVSLEWRQLIYDFYLDRFKSRWHAWFSASRLR
ncbi:hypothetical protein IAQ61_008266 [Plenodomus lingam]|uniref:uncharacterized protein n=1 Tax=Leptosphaeria maculans TaxID=5022 RepID=UPI003330DCCC|nr:hypothetical protein IAQ61_008266 [Plenodomus lingam]